MICLAIFVCSRNSSNSNANLIDVYRDRVPRWKNTNYPTTIVDSCNTTLKTPFKVDGMETISFQGKTSFWCSWSCPTQRETVALQFMNKHLNKNCSFVVKISGKYFTPDLLPQLQNITNQTQVVVQGKQKQYFRQCEIFGMTRPVLSTYLKLYSNSQLTQERRLYAFMSRMKFNAHKVIELSPMRLYNRTRRSDGRILTWL